MELSDKIKELDFLKAYMRYKISLTWAMNTGYYKATYHVPGQFLKCHIFPSQIMTIKEYKECVDEGKFTVMKNYLGINLT